MSRLKNITPSTLSLQMYKTATPQVNFADVQVVLCLKPGEDVAEADWLVDNKADASYNQDIIDGFIASGILTRI